MTEQSINNSRLLPQNYYLDHFQMVLDGIEARYQHLLSSSEAGYLCLLRSLPLDALKLYARLTNRTTSFFRLDKLKYAEINVAEAVKVLNLNKLICFANASKTQDILDCFNMREIRGLLGAELKLSSLFCRSEVDRAIHNWDAKNQWLEKILLQHQILELPNTDKWRFCRFLYFGELKPNLSDFVIHDLGTVESETIQNLQPAFSSRKEAEDCFNMALIYEEFREAKKTKPATALWQWWQSRCITRSELAVKAMPYFDRLVDRLGKLLEKEKKYAEAISLYRTSPASPARERLAKLLIKQKAKDEAKAVCAQILAMPNCAEEYYTATQLIAKLDKTATRSQARSVLAESQSIYLNYPEGGVELSALEHFISQGWDGGHTENWIWNAAFGISFWDIIYDDAQYFHQPLQRAPSDLYNGFYFNRREKIEQRLAAIKDHAFINSHAEKIISEKEGLSNPFVGWHKSLLSYMKDLLNIVPLVGLSAIMGEMAKDLKNNTRGFPDLFIRREADYDFIEIKSENDQLSPQQYFWQQKFKENGINCKVLKVYSLNLQAA